ncbi:MAG: hypothetical protein H6737_25130 [Alphaproteobacteria bacterium]|nr:hypothetical protein [Alphaproteobacteria bacterium]
MLAKLRDTGSWPTWVPGVREVVGEPPSIELQFGGPRPFRCGVALEARDDGLGFQLEQGELRVFSGSVTVEAEAVHVEIDLRFGPTVPGMLWRSLETDYLRDLITGLTGGAPPGSGRHAG